MSKELKNLSAFPKDQPSVSFSLFESNVLLFPPECWMCSRWGDSKHSSQSDCTVQPQGFSATSMSVDFFQSPKHGLGLVRTVHLACTSMVSFSVVRRHYRRQKYSYSSIILQLQNCVVTHRRIPGHNVLTGPRLLSFVSFYKPVSSYPRQRVHSVHSWEQEKKLNPPSNRRFQHAKPWLRCPRHVKMLLTSPFIHVGPHESVFGVLQCFFYSIIISLKKVRLWHLWWLFVSCRKRFILG